MHFQHLRLKWHFEKLDKYEPLARIHKTFYLTTKSTHK